MKHSLLLLSILLTATNGFSIEDHQAKESTRFKRESVEAKNEKFEWLASLGEETSPSGYRKLFIYSSEKLIGVEYKVGEAENWNKMVNARIDTHQAYGSESFLPSAPGQKYTVRGILPDGTRLTMLLELDAKNGKAISVKKIKEESKAEVDAERKTNVSQNEAPLSTSNVLNKALNNIGKRLGNGTCAALAGGQRVGQISGGSGYLQIQPGQVLAFSPGSSFSSSMGRFSVSSQGHYVVVESINPDGSFTFLHQNWAGGSSSGQTVRRDTGNLRSLNGSATIYTGN